MKKIISLALALTLICALFAGCSQDKPYPSGDIQFYVSADAGGGTDSICRKITQIIEDGSDATFYLVNKPGVMDAVAPSLVMDAKADGYTIGNINYGGVVNAEYQQVVNNYKIDRLKFVSLVTEESDAVMISKDAPFTTFEEMIEYAKANPGKVRIADQGIGSRVYLLILKMEEVFGVEFNKISYSSSAPQREAMLNGEVDAAVTSLGDFAALLESGDAIGVCEFSSTRNLAYSDVPTCLELGMTEDMLSGSFLAITVPAETPDEVVTYLEGVFKTAVESQEFIDWTATVGITAHYMNSAELTEFVKNLQEKDFKALDELKAQGLI